MHRKEGNTALEMFTAGGLAGFNQFHLILTNKDDYFK